MRVDVGAGLLETARPRQKIALDAHRLPPRLRVHQGEVVEGLKVHVRSRLMEAVTEVAPGVLVERDEPFQRIAHQADVARAARQLLVNPVDEMSCDGPRRRGAPGDRPGQGLGVLSVDVQEVLAEPALEHVPERSPGAFGDVDEEQRLVGGQRPDRRRRAASTPGRSLSV